jgi:hypothetical protein
MDARTLAHAEAFKLLSPLFQHRFPHLEASLCGS